MHSTTHQAQAWGRFVLAASLLAAIAFANPAEARTGRLLIVTPPDYASSAPLTQLVNGKTAQGLDVDIYTVPANTNRSTIKTYIEGLYGTGNEAGSFLPASRFSIKSERSLIYPGQELYR